MKLKVGLVTGEFPPMEGGVGAFTGELAAALREIGHEIHIISAREARPASAERDFWNPRDPHDIRYAQLHARVNRWWWSANSAVVDVLLRYDLDIVNIQYQAAAYDMRVPAINFLPWRMRGLLPSVVTFHDLRHPYLFPKAGRLRRWVVHHLAKSADGVIVTNADDYRRLRELGLSTKKLRQIPIGSNVKAYTPASSAASALRRELRLGPEKYLIGFFGFLNESKGPDSLIRALAGLDDNFHLAFIGGKVGSSDSTNAAFLERIEQLIQDLGLKERIHWSGFLEERALSVHMAACDIMAMPYRDGLSLRRGTLMAILAHGRPLVTTCPEQLPSPFVHGQNVWLTPLDDPGVLSDAIRMLAADSALRERLGRGAKEVAAMFTWDKIGAETADFYQVLIRGDKGASNDSATLRQTSQFGL